MAIPQSTATNIAGGYLVQPEVQQALLSKVARESALMRLADTIRINSNAATWPVYLGRPTAAFVAEAAAKPTTGADFGTLTAAVKKIATHVRYTQEILEDAQQDPRILINPDVEAAIADLADYHALGTHVGAADTTATFGTSFDTAVQKTTSGGAHVELGTGADALAIALSAAQAKLEAAGYTRGLSVLAGYALKQHLRDARTTTSEPLYYESFTSDGTVPRLMGLPIEFSTNLNRTDAGVYAPFTAGVVGGAGSPSKTVAIVGAFKNAKVVLRNQLTTKVLTEATIGGVNLAETNQIAVQYEVRMGFQVYDLNNAFVRIINAS